MSEVIANIAGPVVASANEPHPLDIWSDTYGTSKTGSWILGYNNLRPVKDVLAELENLKEELSEEDAKATLAEFLYHNPRFLMDYIGGIKMYPMQELILKGWAANDYNLAVWGRGVSKTLAYNRSSMLLSREDGLIALPDLLPNIDFSSERWAQIPTKWLWNGSGWQRTDKIYIQPHKNCLRIQTRDGFRLEGSTNHLIKIWNPETCSAEWKKYDQLKLGDLACISRTPTHWGEVHTQADLDEAYLVGLLIGDGCYAKREYGVKITSADEEILSFVERYHCGKRRNKSGTIAKDISLFNDFYEPFLKKWGLKRSLSYTKAIPQSILNHSDLLKECLMGLFDTDGCVTTNAQVTFCTVSTELAHQIQTALLNYGVIARRRTRKTPSKHGSAEVLSISGSSLRVFKDKVGFRLHRKQARLIAHSIWKCNTNTDVIPGAKEYAQTKIRSRYSLPLELSCEWRDKMRRRDQKSLSYPILEKYVEFFERCNIATEDLAPLKQALKDRFYVSPITQIESFIHDCLDFNVPIGEQYWTNGFISHNSSSAAMFALFWSIFNPGVRIVIASYSFRQSRAILAMGVKLINDEGADLLHACFPKDMTRGTDEWALEVPNGASIRCLPLGDGKKIRGIRADVLIIDEFGFLPETIIGEILEPFLAAKNRIKEQRAIEERENELILAGKMTEDQRTVLDDRKKVIFLSSASWMFEHLYRRFKSWMGLLTLGPQINPDEFKQFKESGQSYFVSRLSWEAAPNGLLDLDRIKRARAEVSEAMFNREYGAQFTADSDGYFRASVMQNCTIPEGEQPCLELVGDPNASYVLGVDQNSSGSEESDHFAMCVMKVVTRQTDKKKFGMVVHSYAVAGCGFSDHALYLLYILTHFNIVYVAVDASQGSELEFINFCNQLDSFKNRGLTLNPINNVDFNRTDFREMLPDIKRGYNLTMRQIVQKQRFSSEWQRPANEYLQGCLDHRNIRFASKIAANDSAAGMAISTDISMLGAHEHFKDMSVSEFISHQDFLVDLTKNECAMIKPKTTDLGTMSFGLPQNLRRTSGANRARKDSYSALLIANWGVKTYLEINAIEVQSGMPEFPYAMVG